MEQRQLEKTRARALTTAAMMVTLTCLVQVLTPPGSHLKLTGFPVIMAGFLLGPGLGALVGAVSDVIGYFLYPSGPFFPGFILTQALTGAIPAWILGQRKISETDVIWSYLWLTVAIGYGQLITSVVMVSAFLELLYGFPFWVQFSYRGLSQFFHIPLYVWLARHILMAVETDPRLVSVMGHLRPPADLKREL